MDTTKDLGFILPQPQFEHTALDMHGYSWWKQITYTLHSPPCFSILVDWHVVLYDGIKVVVPKGFVTDFASIPRIFWGLIEPDGPLYLGAILHDFGYQHGYLLSEFDPSVVYDTPSIKFRNDNKDAFGPYIPVFFDKSQTFFDGLLRDVTVYEIGATVQANEAFYALRAFGMITFEKYRRKGPDAFGFNSLGLPGIMI